VFLYFDKKLLKHRIKTSSTHCLEANYCYRCRT